MRIHKERSEGVLTLRLNRPDCLNAIDEAMARALLDALHTAEQADDVRVIVIRGNGRAFCAGRDVTEPPTPQILALVQEVSLTIVRCAKPVVMAVHGWVVGAGAEWMLDADIVLAARSTRFKLPEVGLGVFATGGVTTLLPRFAGVARAKGLLLLGEEFSAEQAERWGLIWSLVDDDALEAEADRLADQLAGFDPEVVAGFKRVINKMGIGEFAAALEAENRIHAQLGLHGE